jgi:hypothetical protein
MNVKEFLSRCAVGFVLIGLCCEAGAQPAPPLSLNALFQPRYREWIRRHPDEFNWMVLALICGSAPKGLQDARPGSLTTNNVIWETWADDDFTFSIPPNPHKPPAWSERDELLHLMNNPLMLEHAATPRVGAEAAMAMPIPPPPVEGKQEVRRNLAAFSSIVSRGLWYQEGIANWIKAHPDGKLSFFPGSIEIKAVWTPDDGNDNSKFPSHWNLDENGKRYKLLALHIMTNALPEWTWATWEWGGNVNYCVGPGGCSDRFGCTPASGCTLNQLGNGVQLSRSVLNIFRQLKVSKEWTGYRLHGSQILEDNAPLPTVLWNSKMEGKFRSTSSCLACHARARVDRSGRADCTFGLKVQSQNNQEGYLDYPPEPAIPERETTSFIWAFIQAGSIKDGKRACPGN